MPPSERIDLNCDMGEGGGNDLSILPYISSANIACGAHAGDETTMRDTVRAALAAGVAVGAHPGYADREGFGRRHVALGPEDVRALILDQLTALTDIATTEGASIGHVKPHGALYNEAAGDTILAEAVASAVASFDGSLFLYGLSGSASITAGTRAGLPVAREAFADRTYRVDGTLTPRKERGSMIADPEGAVAQVLKIVTEGLVPTVGGGSRAIDVDTICIHGDSPNAPELAVAIRAALDRAGIEVAPLGTAD